MAESVSANKAAEPPESGDGSQYSRRLERISKENLFMVLAMWMECSPLCKKSGEGVDIDAGAVLVTEGNRPSSLAMDCTRDGVHAVARLLIKHSHVLKNSTIYTSRRPCSFCAKLLVQCGISHLYYLPSSPEKPDKEDLYRVDNLLKVAPLAHGYFVPHVGKKVAEETEKKVEDQKRVPETPKKVKECVQDLMKRFWNDEWMVEAAKTLHWTASDDKMRPQFKKDFEAIMKWISEVTLFARHPDNQLVPYKPDSEDVVKQEDLYHHLLAIAAILQQRTDDPRRGVGAVIWKENEIVATGWNGFPSKALYGEFPRASDKDKTASQEQKKYPYVIHAEQNALLMKNTKDISGSTLFVTKTPCQECVPLLKLEGVKTYVIEITEQDAKQEFGKKGENLKYDVFPDEVDKGTFTCFVLKTRRPRSAARLPFDDVGSQNLAQATEEKSTGTSKRAGVVEESPNGKKKKKTYDEKKEQAGGH